ncbi:MAG: HNH endonuclease, partial [Proteobacteria bacterium]|nr:HNH endonuclease [Pseudomonadota bacterium]
MAKSMTEIYLDALKAINGWATVSEWAIKVGELYPEILEKAEKEAKAYENPSTGLREIAARISSAISRSAYQGV